jgi:hypothetical protein
VSERALRTTCKETAVNLLAAPAALGLLAGPIDDGRSKGVTLLHAGGVGVANFSDDMLDIVRAAGDV